MKELQRKFRKLLLFIDKTTQHRSSIIIRKHLEENKEAIRIEYLPKGSPNSNAVEECWRQGKDDLLVSKYYPKFPNLKSAITNYYRTKRFKLDITKYLFFISLGMIVSELMLLSVATNNPTTTAATFRAFLIASTSRKNKVLDSLECVFPGEVQNNSLSF